MRRKSESRVQSNDAADTVIREEPGMLEAATHMLYPVLASTIVGSNLVVLPGLVT